MVKSTNYEAPHHVMFQSPINSCLLGPNILHITWFSNTLKLQSGLSDRYRMLFDQ